MDTIYTCYVGKMHLDCEYFGVPGIFTLIKCIYKEEISWITVLSCGTIVTVTFKFREWVKYSWMDITCSWQMFHKITIIIYCTIASEPLN